MALTDSFPHWLKGYDASAFPADLLAGFILAILLVPQAMAYALLAGLPPSAGLYAAIAPPLIYMVFGTSAYVSMGPVALASLLVADALGGTDLPRGEAAAIIALETGAMLALLGLFRLGRLVNFVSEPAMLGFTAAAAVLIAASQLPPLLGLDVERNGDLIAAARGIIPALERTNVAALAIGGTALALLVVANRYAAAGLWKLGVHPPWRQALVKSVPLLVIVGAAVAAAAGGYRVATVGEASAGLPGFSLPPFALGPWLALLPSSAVVAVIVFVIGAAVAKSLAGRERRALDTSREALAIGAANIGAGLTGGYAVGVSLSRSALVYESGARSPIASGTAALIVLAVVAFLSPALAYLPETALAALVISAVFGLVKTRQIAAIRKQSKAEFSVFLVTLAATLAFGVKWGLALGALLGLAVYLWVSSVPRVTRVGSLDENGDAFRSVERDGVEPDTLPVLVVRIDRSIYFGNAAYCEDRILSFLARHPDASCLVLDMRAVNSIDASGVAMLQRLIDTLGEKKLTVDFAATHQPVHEALQRNHVIRTREFFTTVPEGVESCRERADGKGEKKECGEA
ncbi:MAG: SulP family inorganic anion transporter [Sphingomonadaceae bacterium]